MLISLNAKSIFWVLLLLTWLSVFAQESLITFGRKIHQQTDPDSREDRMCPSPRSFKHPSANNHTPFSHFWVTSDLQILRFHFTGDNKTRLFTSFLLWSCRLCFLGVDTITEYQCFRAGITHNFSPSAAKLKRSYPPSLSTRGGGAGGQRGGTAA